MTSRAPLVLALVLLPGLALAHHPVSDSGAAPLAPQTSVSLELQAGGFDRGVADVGQWQLVTPELEVRVHPRVALGAHIPLARVRWDDGHEVAGVGDTEVVVRVHLHSSDHERFALAAGVGLGLPTGSVDDRFGGGHIEASPFALVALSRERGRTVFMLVGLVMGHVALFDLSHDDGAAAAAPALAAARRPRHATLNPVHGAAFAPHAERELTQRVTLTVAHGAWSGGGGLELVETLDDFHAGPLTGRLELGATRGAWRVSAGADTTLAGTARYDWRGRLAVARRF